MPHFFAYGCFLSTRVMQSVCPAAGVVAPAVLPRHRLTFPVVSADWHGGVASVEACDEADVHGVVYDIAEADLVALDAYEAVDEGLYERAARRVTLRGGESIDAWLYIALPDERGTVAIKPPSRLYIETLIDGAREQGLDEIWIAHLATHL